MQPAKYQIIDVTIKTISIPLLVVDDNIRINVQMQMDAVYLVHLEIGNAVGAAVAGAGDEVLKLFPVD